MYNVFYLSSINKRNDKSIAWCVEFSDEKKIEKSMLFVRVFKIIIRKKL